MAQDDKMNARRSPYAPAPPPQMPEVAPPSSLAKRSVASPYTLTADTLAKPAPRSENDNGASPHE